MIIDAERALRLAAAGWTMKSRVVGIELAYLAIVALWLVPRFRAEPARRALLARPTPSAPLGHRRSSSDVISFSAWNVRADRRHPHRVVVYTPFADGVR